MKLWAGRFSKEADETLSDFNSSISFDWRMYEQDITGSIAHAQMLAECGVISDEDKKAIHKGLTSILDDLRSGALVFDPAAEDIHTFIETELTRRVGQAGKRLHTARSRNDQVALDLRMFLRGEIDAVGGQIEELIAVLCRRAAEHAGTVMPGYTHLQRAQPVTFGHHLMAYAWMLQRDRARLLDAFRRMNLCPLGAGALAGTTYPIDRERTSQLLGFDGPVPNSLDAVADRDFCLELAADLSILMVHLSRFSEEIILWCSSEFSFVELDDAFATGSSIMPQKKNPDVAELVRGKAGRVFGDLMGLLTVMKSLPLAYNKDMQEDKEAIFDCIDTVRLCLRAFTPMLRTMQVRGDTMRAAAGRGFLNATDCADYLVGKGMPFRDAYKIVGRLVALCIERGGTLESLPLDTLREYSEHFGEDVYAVLDLEHCVRERSCLGGPAPQSVHEQIRSLRDILAKSKEGGV